MALTPPPSRAHGSFVPLRGLQLLCCAAVAGLGIHLSAGMGSGTDAAQAAITAFETARNSESAVDAALHAAGAGLSRISVTVKSNDRVFDTSNNLLADESTDGPVVASQPTADELKVLTSEALRRWIAETGDASFAAMASTIQITVTDLPGLRLGEYVNGNILVDFNAAGYGWFVDGTPRDDREYLAAGDSLMALFGSAHDRIDLDTTCPRAQRIRSQAHPILAAFSRNLPCYRTNRGRLATQPSWGV